MSEAADDAIAEIPTATPGAENVATENEATAAEGSQETQQPETPKTFTQEDVDRIAQKERAKAERRAIRQVGEELKTLREQVQQIQQPKQEQQQANQAGEPQRADFETYEDYVRAIGRHEAQKELAKSRQEAQQREQQASAERYQREFQKVAEQRIEAGRKEYADFDEVINEAVADGLIQPGGALHMAIIESDLGHKIAYHLAKNPDEAERIAALSPLSMARELGKLEAKIAAAPAQKPTAAPIDPVGGNSRSSTGPSDTDDAETWRRKREAQLRKR